VDQVNGISESHIKEILTGTRGDLFLAAQQLGITLRQMDNIVRFDQAIGIHLGEIQQVIAENPDYEKRSGKWFESQINRTAALYKLVGLEELYKLATMGIDSENAALMNVKRQAAFNLRGAEITIRSGAEVDAVLEELARSYEIDAPRIKEVRQKMLENRQGALLPAGTLNEPVELRHPELEGVELIERDVTPGRVGGTRQVEHAAGIVGAPGNRQQD
jgi:hypothetical protein